MSNPQGSAAAVAALEARGVGTQIGTVVNAAGLTHEQQNYGALPDTEPAEKFRPSWSV